MTIRITGLRSVVPILFARPQMGCLTKRLQASWVTSRFALRFGKQTFNKTDSEQGIMWPVKRHVPSEIV